MAPAAFGLLYDATGDYVLPLPWLPSLMCSPPCLPSGPTAGGSYDGWQSHEQLPSAGARRVWSAGNISIAFRQAPACPRRSHDGVTRSHPPRLQLRKPPSAQHNPSQPHPARRLPTLTPGNLSEVVSTGRL
jgi:hypothetical protein